MADIYEVTRLPFEAISDYHVHCNYSFDAEGSIDEYCEAAIKRGLAEIYFTTHFDTNPNGDGKDNFVKINGELMPTTIENMAPYVDDVLRAHETYYPFGLSVKLGVEIGWYEGCEEIVQKLKDTYDFDYLLCGVHDLDNICFCCRKSYEKLFSKYSLQELAGKYFEQLIKAAKTGLFDTLAHACYYLRYGRQFHLTELDMIHNDYLEDFFKTLKENNTGLEINTSGMRHGNNHYYPHLPVINAAKRAGVDIHHLGSDAHHPTQVGFDFEMAAVLVPEAVKGCESS